MAIIELTNPDIKMPGGALLKKEELGIKWERVIDSSKLMLCDIFGFRNYGLQQATLPFTLTFQSEFEPFLHRPRHGQGEARHALFAALERKCAQSQVRRRR